MIVAHTEASFADAVMSPIFQTSFFAIGDYDDMITMLEGAEDALGFCKLFWRMCLSPCMAGRDEGWG